MGRTILWLSMVAAGCGPAEPASPPPPPTAFVPPAPSSTAPPAPATTEPSTAAPTTDLRVVPYPKPAFSPVDVEPFLKLGCVAAEGALDCKKAQAIVALGCNLDKLYTVDELGALTPRASSAVCVARVQRPTDPTGLVHLGCMMPAWRRLVVATAGKVEVVTTPEELAKRFGPVETPEEAIAFAALESRAEPTYTLDVPPQRRLLAPGELHLTHATRAANGFDVRLVGQALCGCGPHPVLAVDVLVHRDGRLDPERSQEIFTDPARDHVCID